MDPQRWQEVDRIFEQALDLPPEERPAFLDRACAADPSLRAEVERLLAADQAGRGFLEDSPGALLGLALDEREDTGSLGPYRLLRKIGSGGMGTVYLARREDEHYQRDVAIKVLRSGLASTEAFHRFLAERQILAQLEHPNIARLYDGGSTEDGRPYLVMELVEGVPVDDYCDRHRLTVDQRLALFQKICAAVQCAHQSLLVHRDLKPGNILITPEGEPKLLDFGIAKRLVPETAGALDRTRDGLRLLTPRYASPEQVRGGPITTASDVYSLGVILYELLAGRAPYPLSAEPPFEFERLICERDPERPSAALFRPAADGELDAQEVARARRTRPAALADRLRGDLDNIILMAMRKEPDRRYGSAAQLAQDLERSLSNRPVAARPDTLRYRARKFVRRHRAGLAATAAVVLLVLFFVGSLVAQGRQLARERDKARHALSFLVDTFKQADPYQTKGENLTAREILDQGADRVSRDLAGQPDVQAALMDAIGEVDRGLGRLGEAQPLLERALALRRSICVDSLEVAESLERLADLENDRADRESAESHLREALAIRRRRPEGDDAALARTLNRLGQVLVSKGVAATDVPPIEALHREALEIAREAEGPQGLTVAETLLALANLHRSQGGYPEAERLFREGLEIERQALGDQAPRLWRDRSELAVLLFEAGKLKESEGLSRRCLQAQRRILGPSHPDTMATLNNLAMAIQHQARYAEAETLHRESLALARSVYGPLHWQVGMILGNLAAAVDAQGLAKAEAIRLYEESLEIRRRTLGDGDPLVAQNLLLLAELYRNDKNFEKSLNLARQALEILTKAEGPDHPHVAFAVREIGRSYVAQGRAAEAEPYLRRCLEIRLAKLEPRHPDVAKAQVSLGRCLITLGRYDEAEGLLRQAQAALAAVYGADNEFAQLPARELAEIARLRALKAAGAGAAATSRR